MIDYDNQYSYGEESESATPDGMEEHESSNPEYKKKSEKKKVDDYKEQDFP